MTATLFATIRTTPASDTPSSATPPGGDGPGVNLTALVDSVLSLRKHAGLPSIDDGPRELVNCLMKVRGTLDLIEERLTIATRARAGFREAYKQAVATHDDAWAQSIGAAGQKSRGPASWGDPAPRERYAEADLVTFEKKRSMRKLERWLDQANDAVDIISRSYRSLDELRRDLHLILRAMTVESSLER